MWKELIYSCDEKAYVNFSQPADEEDINAIAAAFGVQVPAELADFLKETNGDGGFILSAQQIVTVNEELRQANRDTCMPLNCLLFVAENGCGDYYGYPVINGQIKQDRLFFWYHETDDRNWVAGSLKELLTKYYRGEI